MGIKEIKDKFKLLSPKEAKLAEKYFDNEDWDSLLMIVEDAINEADTDVQIASEEDNGQLVRAKSETLDALMHLKYNIEDYIDFSLEDYSEDYDDEDFI